jgi:hypothetical protein
MAELTSEQERVLSEQISSGKSIAEFCRERGIKAEQVYEWRQRRKGTEKKLNNAPRFSRVETGVEITVELESGIKLKVSLESLKAVLCELGTAR